MKGLILAAGKGERFRPLTPSLPKALIPLAGRPLIEYPLSNLRRSKIKRVGIVVSPSHKNRIKQALRRWGIDFIFIVQKLPEGTAKAVELAKGFIGKEAFLLTYCDSVSPYDFTQIIEEHRRHKPLATMLVNKGDKFQETGLVKMEAEYVVKIVEKPKKKFSDYGSSGVMVIEPLIFKALAYIRPSSGGEYHIGDALQYLIDRGKEVRYKIIDTWRVNVNCWKDVEKAERLILRCPNHWG